MTQSIELMVPQYMTRFQCIAERCEDTCCTGWVVNVDKPTYERLEKIMAESGETEKFQNALYLVEGENATEVNYAHLKHQPESGGCTFLDDRLCGLQNKHGHDVLPMTCKNFPRRLLKADSEFELSGDLGCPEVARLALLSEDAMDLTGMPLSDAGFAMVKQEFSKDDPRPYHRHVNDIRTLFIHLMTRKEYSLKQRLFFILFFSNRVSAFFHQGQTGDISQALKDEMAFISQPEALSQLAQRINEVEVSPEQTFALFNEIMNLGYNSKNPTIRILLQEVFPGSESEVAGKVMTHSQWSTHLDNGSRLTAKAGERIEQYFSHIALNFWLQQWHIRSPNLIVHAQRLLMEMAIAKVMLFNHPGLLTKLDLPDEGFLPLLDAMAVRVVYTTNRFIAHSGLLQRVEQRLEESGLQSFGGAVCLLQY